MTSEKDTLLKVLSDIERDQKQMVKAQRTLDRDRAPVRLQRHLSWWTGIALMFLTVFFGGWAKLGGAQWAAGAALASVASCYLVIIAQPFLMAWTHRRALRETLRLPFTATMRINIQTPMEVDKLHFPRLTALPRLELDLGLTSLKNEALFLEKCTGWVVGSVEKIGLLPGCIAIIYATSNGSSSPALATSLAWGNVIFTAFGVLANVYVIRYQRMISLIELAIKHQETLEKITSGGTVGDLVPSSQAHSNLERATHL
ncbi:hypothetical protein [Pseudomonas fulva]|uniref:hypothetical protein n=1 Tax=Pseudomonas fulva TaxID=47880 RepID=UPI0018AC4298|nr:hypothetical protein [Pseudomonas fulva]MBF8774091.1 hypothetical protein [Pseudomonas fulva]